MQAFESARAEPRRRERKNSAVRWYWVTPAPVTRGQGRSRHDRWTAFEPISKLARSTTLRQQLPLFSGIDQNSFSLSPIPRSVIRDCGPVGIAADHVTFISFIRRYASGTLDQGHDRTAPLLDRIGRPIRTPCRCCANDPAADRAGRVRRTPRRTI